MRSLFSKNVKELRFNSKDLDNLDQVDLFFLVNEAKGNLIIKLNNIEIFNNKAQGLQTILLPKGLLKDNNKLTFELSSPGINFFSRNKYLLTNIKLRQNFELINTKETRTFSLTETETGDAKLNFFVFCNDAKSNARLRIFLNNNELSNQVIGCISSEKTFEISKDDLKEGRNNLLFEIDKGDYLLNDITVKVGLEEGGAKAYKFSLTETQLTNILDNDREVVLEFDFNDEKKKRATINVNGNEFTLETEDLEYSRFITSLVKEGTNLIRINPDNEFIVDLLEIRIE